MPKLVRLYLKQIAIGFGLSGIFVTALLYTNVGNLWHLVSSSEIGWVAAFMLYMFHGLVFAGVQFAITVMRMEHEDDEPKGGKRVPVATNIPARIEATAGVKPRKRR